MTTTLERATLAVAVQKALETVEHAFQPTEMIVEPDGDGGARIRFAPIILSATYTQRDSWVAAHLAAQLPYADIYPIFLRGDLVRVDGQPLVAPITNGHVFMGQAAVQVSRRSPRRDAAIETVAMKFMKVIDWVNTQ